jgi:hypothetical protein
MKRSWDTIREILLKSEELELDTTLRLSDFDEDRTDEIAYHVKLLEESGLIKVSIVEFCGGAGIHFDLERLTWSGHDFLDAVRNETTWSKTKAMISDKGGAMTFELIKSVAIALAKTAIGI